MSDTKITMEEFEKLLGDKLELKIREMGLDKVDAKHAIFPTDEDNNGDDLKNLSKEARVKKFLQAVVNNDSVTAKALSEGTDADGGYLVPDEFRASIVEKRDKAAVIRPRANVIPMGRDKLEMPVENAGITLYWKAENTALTESNPTFANLMLDTNKLTGLGKMSREFFADSAVNIMDYLSRLYGRKFAAEEDKKFMTGSGTGEPKGIHQYTVSQAVAQAGANLVANDIKNLFYTLPVQYRDNAVFIMHNTRIQLLDKLQDTTGRYLWASGLDGRPGTLMGRPVLEQNDLPTNLGAGTNESVIYFGDLNYYLIGDREQMSIETTRDGAGAFETHQVAVKVIERVDGQLSLTDSFAKMTAVK
jgi:HK97 family phage major capsid protein